MNLKDFKKLKGKGNHVKVAEEITVTPSTNVAVLKDNDRLLFEAVQRKDAAKAALLAELKGESGWEVEGDRVSWIKDKKPESGVVFTVSVRPSLIAAP